MTDRKISELNNITGADLADNDEFVVVDTSADETKAITYGELKNFNGTLTSDGLTVSGDAVFTPDNDGVRITGANYATLRLEENDTTDVNTSIFNSGGDFVITTSSDDRSSTTDRIRLDHATGDISFYEDTGTTAKLFWDASAESLGIGTSSPAQELDVNGQVRGVDRYYFKRASDSYSLSALARWDGSTGSPLTGTAGINTVVGSEEASSNVIFAPSNTERMRIDSSGNVLVGTTDTTLYNNTTGTGTKLGGDGRLDVARQDDTVATFNRTGSSFPDGEIIRIVSSGTTIGAIGSNSGYVYIGSNEGNDAYLLFGADIVSPATSTGANRDGAIDLGHSSARFDDIFATNGTIQTSDRNEKQDIASLTSAEMLVAKRISALFKTFRWKDKVAAKGNDARTHSGIIAQDVQAAFAAESLDASKYALWCSDTWWEHDVDVPAVEAADAVDAVYRKVTDSDGNEINELVTPAKEAVEAKDAYTRTDTYYTESEAPEGATSKTRMGIRYPELLSFVAAYNEQRFAAIETRLTALEG